MTYEKPGCSLEGKVNPIHLEGKCRWGQKVEAEMNRDLFWSWGTICASEFIIP